MNNKTFTISTFIYMSEFSDNYYSKYLKYNKNKNHI